MATGVARDGPGMMDQLMPRPLSWQGVAWSMFTPLTAHEVLGKFAVVQGSGAHPHRAVDSQELETFAGVGSWVLCSMGMIVFNKLAIRVFPAACCLVVLQFSFTVLFLIVFCWRSLSFGSLRDVLRWCGVVPPFVGMMLTSMLALEYAPMTLVVTFRALSPIFSLVFERCFPNPLEVSRAMLASLAAMVLGVFVYVYGMEGCHFAGAGWAVLNNFFAVAERLLQRLMIARDQQPVDISKTGMTFLNNLVGIVPVLLAGIFSEELNRIPAAVADLDAIGITWITASCLVSVGISYSGIWAQSLISATSALVLVNTNKFAIVLLEVFVLRSKDMPANQIAGCIISILAGIAYAKARQEIEEQSSSKKLCLEANISEASSEMSEDEFVKVAP